MRLVNAAATGLYASLFVFLTFGLGIAITLIGFSGWLIVLAPFTFLWGVMLGEMVSSLDYREQS